MGYCQVGGHTEACTQADCDEFGGNYVDEPEEGEGCFMTAMLKDERAILVASTTMYPAMVQFRDDIMRRTPLGRRLISYIDEFNEEAKTIASQDPKLVTEIIWLAAYISPFIQTMSGQRQVAYSAVETPLSRLASEYRPSTHKAFVSIVNRFKAKGSKKFIAALTDSEKILSRFVGLTPAEALREIRQWSPSRKPTKPK